MTDATADTSESAAKPRKLAYALWLILALTGAAGGYYAVHAGLVPVLFGDRPAGAESPGHGVPHAATEATAFVAIDPIMITLTDGGGSEHLRFRAELEVAAGEAAEVTRLMPRIVDVLNGYLRALEHGDLRDSEALIRLRGQMLRRIGIVVGPDRVRDLLIMEFVLN